jgi:hypothetical protein
MASWEGRGWRGFHHHTSLCIAACGFLVAERCRFFPDWRPGLKVPEPPKDYQPRGAPRPPRAAQPRLDRHLAPLSRRRARALPASAPLLLAHLSSQAYIRSLWHGSNMPLPLKRAMLYSSGRWAFTNHLPLMLIW